MSANFFMEISFSIRNKINVYSRLVLFPLYFTKFSLNTVSIRVRFGSSKEKITTRRIYIYLIADTYVVSQFSLNESFKIYLLISCTR